MEFVGDAPADCLDTPYLSMALSEAKFAPQLLEFVGEFSFEYKEVKTRLGRPHPQIPGITESYWGIKNDLVCTGFREISRVINPEYTETVHRNMFASSRVWTGGMGDTSHKEGGHQD